MESSMGKADLIYKEVHLDAAMLEELQNIPSVRYLLRESKILEQVFSNALVP
jgi:hypothetical protein